MAVKKKGVEIDTKDAQQQVDKLKESMAGLNKENNAATTSVKQLRKELKAQKDAMLSAEEGTKEYIDALQKAAGIQHTLKEQMEEVNASAMDFGQIAGNVVKATGGIVAGFQAAQATMNLFGIENEAVLESLEKMQNLMAITQAIPALDDGAKAFIRLGRSIKTATASMSVFKKFLMSTGIGAAVVALGLLVANWDKVTEAMRRWGIIHEDTKKKLEEQKKKAEDLKQKLEEAQKAYSDWEKQTAINNLSSEAKEKYQELENTIEGANLKIAEFQAKMNQVGNDKSAWESLRDQAREYEAIRDNAKAAQSEILKNAENTKQADEERKKAAEAAKKAAEERKKAAEEEKKEIEEIKKKYSELSIDISLYGASEYQKDLAALVKAEQQALKTIEDAEKKGVVTKEQAEKDKTTIQKYYITQRENAAKEEAARQREISIEMIDTSYQLEQAKLQKQYDEKLISEQEFNDRKKELQTNYVQDYIDNIQFILDTEKNLTDEQILDLTNKINDARSSLKENKETKENKDTDPNVLTAKQISEAINESALALNDFSNNPAWGNILKNVATLAANWDTLQENIGKKGKDTFTAYAQIAATALGAVAQMMNGLAAEQDTSNKEGFESAKKFQIAGATMSMLSGIASAWASSMQLGFILGPIVGSALSAMMLGIGIAQIDKIKNTQFGGSGNVSGSSATPNAGAVNSIIAPVQYTQDVQGANIEDAIKDTRVYVTETDISNTQKKVDVAESEARF